MGAYSCKCMYGYGECVAWVWLSRERVGVDGLSPPLSPTFVPQNIVNIQLTFVSIRKKNICQWLSIGQTLQNTVHKTSVP